jgi:hypothetical protein
VPIGGLRRWCRYPLTHLNRFDILHRAWLTGGCMQFDQLRDGTGAYFPPSVADANERQVTTTQRARNTRFFLYSACAIALQTFIALIGAELVLRILDLRYLRLENGSNQLPYQHDPEIGWVPIANWVGPFGGFRTTTVRQNSLGLRDIEHDGAPRPTIIVVGDSFVWGYDVEANERFTELLRRRFSQYRIVNAGVAGYGTDQEYLLLRRLWSKLTPQVVVLVYSQSNDRVDNSGNMANDDYFKPYIEQTPHGDWRFRGQPVPHPRYSYFRENWFVRNVLLGRLAVSAYVHLRHPRVRVPDPTEHLIGMMRDLVEGANSWWGCRLRNRNWRPSCRRKKSRMSRSRGRHNIPTTARTGLRAVMSWSPSGSACC